MLERRVEFDAPRRPDAIQEQPHATREQPDATGDQPDATQEQHDATREQPDATRERLDATQEQLDARMQAIAFRMNLICSICERTLLDIDILQYNFCNSKIRGTCDTFFEEENNFNCPLCLRGKSLVKQQKDCLKTKKRMQNR